jgi:hypothetical protein
VLPIDCENCSYLNQITIPYHEPRQVPGVRRPFDFAEPRILNTDIAPGNNHIHGRSNSAVSLGGI